MHLTNMRTAPQFALKDIDLVIEEKKTTAIVGVSGSGKTNC